MPLPLFTSDVKQEVAIRKGDGDFYNIPSKTVMECFDETVAKHGSKPALHQKIPKKVSAYRFNKNVGMFLSFD